MAVSLRGLRHLFPMACRITVRGNCQISAFRAKHSRWWIVPGAKCRHAVFISTSRHQAFLNHTSVPRYTSSRHPVCYPQLALFLVLFSHHIVRYCTLILDTSGEFSVVFSPVIDYVFQPCRGGDSSVGIATCYGLDGPGIESRWGARFSAPVQTGPWGPPSLYNRHHVFSRG